MTIDVAIRPGVALIGLLCGVALIGCEREARRLDTAPGPAPAATTQVGSLRAGPSVSAPAASAPSGRPSRPKTYEENAYAVAQGKRLYRWYNCNGCHAGGGGGMGPALMDDKWIYGHEAEQIVATILQGRPNGMPSFAGRIPPEQVWQLAAYVRSMSGQLPSDVAPSRGDSLSAGPPEQRRDTERPRLVGPGGGQ